MWIACFPGIEVCAATAVGICQACCACSFRSCRTTCRNPGSRCGKVSFKSLGCVLSTFRWECRGGREVEESVTQFWSNRGQEPAVEPVMTRVNEDGLWVVADWGKKLWDF